MANAVILKTSGSNLRSSQEDLFKLISQLEIFLEEFKNIEYVSQLFQETILGSKPVSEDSNESHNKLKISFDNLITRNLPFLSKSDKKFHFADETTIDIKSFTNSLITTENSKKSYASLKKDNPKYRYKGDMENNLRNGEFTA